MKTFDCGGSGDDDRKKTDNNDGDDDVDAGERYASIKRGNQMLDTT